MLKSAVPPLAFVSLLALCGASFAQTLWENAGARVESLNYTCDSAIDDLSVAYFTAADGTSFAAVHIAGVVHAMVQEVSGSGVRYADIDAQSGYRIHAKGDGLLLLKKPAGGGAVEELLADCTAARS